MNALPQPETPSTLARPYPLVSIVIPTYNQAGMLDRAIRSALAQRYSNLEIVVADDASQDATRAVVSRYLDDSRLRYCPSERRLGRVANYRRGLYELARGEWVLNLDGDDYLTDNDFVADAVEVTRRHRDVVLVLGGYRILSVQGRVERAELPTASAVEIVDGKGFFAPPFRRFVAGHGSALYRREVAIRVGFYDRDTVSSDYESLLKLALCGKVGMVGRTVATWRLHGANASLNLSTGDLFAFIEGASDLFHAALTAGIDRRHAEAWRDRLLAEYILGQAPLIRTGGITGALAAVRALRIYPGACRRALLGLVSPKVLVQWLLLAAGGPTLVAKARLAWWRLRWRRYVESRDVCGER